MSIPMNVCIRCMDQAMVATKHRPAMMLYDRHCDTCQRNHVTVYICNDQHMQKIINEDNDDA